MNTIDRDAVLALLDGVIANPGPSPAAGALALVLRMQVERLPVLLHTHCDECGSPITAWVAQDTTKGLAEFEAIAVEMFGSEWRGCSK